MYNSADAELVLSNLYQFSTRRSHTLFQTVFTVNFDDTISNEDQLDKARSGAVMKIKYSTTYSTPKNRASDNFFRDCLSFVDEKFFRRLQHINFVRIQHSNQILCIDIYVYFSTIHELGSLSERQCVPFKLHSSVLSGSKYAQHSTRYYLLRCRCHEFIFIGTFIYANVWDRKSRYDMNYTTVAECVDYS